MKKKEKFVKILDLSVSQVLLSFVNKELLPGTKISKNHFWNGFNKSVHELAKKNKELIDIREKIQIFGKLKLNYLIKNQKEKHLGQKF